MNFARARRTPAALLAFAAVFSALSARADLRWAASTRADWAENISRSSSPLNWKDATTLETSLDATYPRAFARNWLAAANVQADYLAVSSYTRNNDFAFGPRLDLQRKFGLGAYAPALQGSVGLVHHDVRLPGASGWTTEASLRLAQRFTSAFRASVGIAWHQHAAAAPTFDVRSHTTSANLAWAITPRWQLSGSFARLSGELIANASSTIFNRALTGLSGPLVAATYNARPWSVTDSYGPGWISYRIDARADTSSLALSTALWADTTLELRATTTRVLNEALVRYKTDILSLGLVHRF